jgi:Kdo2-lipid IVA lauroyltransferase/acyltransferase
LTKFQDLIRTFYYALFEIIARSINYNSHYLYKIGNFLGLIRYNIGYVGSTRSKRNYIDAISIALNINDRKKAAKILESFWINHQKGFIELFLSQKYSKENIDKIINFKGIDNIDNALEKGKGVVLTVPHFGNERFIHIGLALKGYPVSVITSKFTQTSKIIRDIKLNAFLKLHGVGFPDDSPKWMYDSMYKNRILQITPPANEGPKGLKIHFLNHDLLVSKTPARLALKTGAVLIPAFAFRNRDDTHTIVFEKEIQIKNTGDKSKDIEKITSDFLNVFNAYIKQYPEQFYWMWLMIKRDEANKYIRERNSE